MPPPLGSAGLSDSVFTKSHPIREGCLTGPAAGGRVVAHEDDGGSRKWSSSFHALQVGVCLSGTHCRSVIRKERDRAIVCVAISSSLLTQAREDIHVHSLLADI
jgi:hypothetical protein